MNDVDKPLEKSPVELSEALEKVDGDREFLKELFDDFTNDYPQQLDKLAQGISTGDFDEVEHTAHSIKGAAGALSAKKTQELAFRLEQMGRDKKLDNAQELLVELKDELQRIEDWVMKI